MATGENLSMGLLNILTGFLDFLFLFPPIVDIIVVIIGLVLLLLMVKRFRLNSIIVQIIGIISLFLYPISLIAVAIVPSNSFFFLVDYSTINKKKHELVVSLFCILVLSLIGYMIYPILTLPLESLPTVAIMLFFSIWFIFFILKVKILFEKKIILFILIAAHIIFSILACGLHCLF